MLTAVTTAILILVSFGLWILHKRAIRKIITEYSTPENLSEQESNFYTITEAANDGILVNQSGKHVYANKGIAQMLGYTRDELIGTGLRDVVHPDEVEQVYQRYQNRLKGNNEPNQYETAFISKHGDKIPVELTATLTTWHGKPAGLAIIRDITERKLIEKTLRDSEKRYRSLVENSPDAIVVIDADTGYFVEANDKTAELFKLDKPALFNQPVLDMSPAQQPAGHSSREEWHKTLNRVIHGEQLCFEWTFQNSDKLLFPCEVRLTRMPFPNRKLVRGSLINIMQRKQIESALAASELRLQHFFQASFEILVFHDQGLILDVNENVTAIAGYTRNDIIGHHVLEFIAPHCHQAVVNNMQDDYEEPYEIDILRKDGGSFPAIVKGKSIATDTAPQRVVSIVDNTKLKNAENNLIRSGRELQAILDNIIDTFYRTNAAGELIMVSPSVFNLLGYTPEEVMGRRLSDYYVEADGREKFLAAIQANNGRIKGYEAAMRHKDGTEVWVATNARVMLDEAGHFLGIEGTTRDITLQRNITDELRISRDNLEQRVTERTRELSRKIDELEDLQHELKASEQRFHTLFDNAVDIFLLHDIDGRLVDANQLACRSLGYSKQELLQLTVDDIDIGKNPQPIRDLAESLAGGESFRIDSVLRRKDNSSFPVEVNVGLLEKDNHHLFLALIRDMTERKYAELQILAAKEEAEYANKAKTEFLSRMSHELRTPMNAIIGFGELLESDPANPLTESQHDNVNEILNAARHLLELINEILDLARIESGRIALNISNITLYDVVEECIILVQPLAFERHIQINNQIEQTGLEIEADNTRLKQIIINLLSNAIKYNVDHGAIFIECLRQSEAAVRLIISDTGPGLSQDEINHLFQPFERLQADSHNIQGSGIGLVITRHLVELMGGKIGVTSTPGKGSRFWVEFHLPRQEHNQPIAEGHRYQ
ncbi:MAG: PAS domain S-box protein [Gammaproteobacteria bacterium]|nr:PAS domain S-box protein [Gammaproteobacteria bacterium]MDH5651793.1 PAS domain S-box protein [Gammaproteobacteria bacterium]